MSRITSWLQTRITVKQIFNCCILTEKHLQHLYLYHIFADFKKAFDKSGMRSKNSTSTKVLSKSLKRCIIALQAQYVYCLNKNFNFFRMTFGICEGRLYHLCILENNMWNSPWPLHFHFYWQADFQPTFCRKHWFNSRH